MSLIPLRTSLMPLWFSPKELQIMDDFTANNQAVLASLGGVPQLPGGENMDNYGLERRHSEKMEGVPRQRAGSVHR